MDRMSNPSGSARCARVVLGLRSWQFPVLLVLGGSVIAACSSNSKDPAEPPTPTALEITTAPPTTFADRAVLSPAPVIQLVDVGGDPVSTSGVSVSATLSAGTGSLQGTTSALTNSTGQATFNNLSIAGTVGTKGITFTSAGLTSVSANGLTLTVGPLSLATATSATSQSALTSTAVAALPSVHVTDADGNPIQGQAVTFAVTAGGGSLTGGNQITNASGNATVTSWTTGAAAGTNTMTATVGALPVVTFNVSAAPAGTATQLQLLTAPPSTIANRATITPNPVIQLLDAVGTPVTTAGVGVTVALTGGGTLGGTTTINTDAQGRSTFSNLNIGGLVGAKRLNFSSTGLVGVQSADINLTAGAASNIMSNSTTIQNGSVGQAVTALPSVRVTDQDDNGVAGVSVTFTLTGGGGSISGAVSNTNVSGTATLGSWTLGGVAGANTVNAAGTSVTLTGAPVTFTVNATASASQFTIQLEFETSATPAQQQAFTNAKARWEAVITGDLTDVNVSGAPACGGVTSTGIVDDVKILVKLEPIDGVGNVLGSAGPCLVRNSNTLTVIGTMRFDTADLPNLEANGSLDDVILHEMGHVLGYGTLWTDFNLLSGACDPNVPGSGTSPIFTGANAVAAFTGSNGGGAFTSVPVENFPTGGCNNGTRDSHWEESVFQSEVMTGFISGTLRPLSLTSVQQMKDLGYTVNAAAADPFNISTQPTLRAGEDVIRADLRGDILNAPIYAIDDRGRVTLYRDRK